MGDCDYRWEGMLARWHRCTGELTHDGPHECICGCTYEPTEP